MTPATKVYRDRTGWHTLDVLLNYSRPARLEDALVKVQNGRTVFVAREDAGKVMEAVRSGETR